MPRWSLGERTDRHQPGRVVYAPELERGNCRPGDQHAEYDGRRELIAQRGPRRGERRCSPGHGVRVGRECAGRRRWERDTRSFESIVHAEVGIWRPGGRKECWIQHDG